MKSIRCRKDGRLELKAAPEIQKQAQALAKKLSLSHLQPKRIFCFRSLGSKSAAFARIWSLPRIWQKALKTPPAYCLEVLTEKFNKLPFSEKEKILIHELLHIPQNFSGSLVSEKRVRKLFREIKVMNSKIGKTERESSKSVNQ